jgi:plasmid stabilization system protein ParE
MKLIVLDAAQAELEEAQAYYLQCAPAGIAAAFVTDYEKSVRRILEFPRAGTLISKQLRIQRMRHFPYSIIYQACAELVTVHAVAHQRRRFGYWAGRR